MKQLTQHFNLAEFFKTSTGLKNETTDQNILANIENLAETLENIRVAFGAPVYISSGFRSAAVNKKVGGASGSQHTKGEAADLQVCKGGIPELKRLLKVIVTCGVAWDQLIVEHSGTSHWIHISSKRKSSGPNRNMILLYVDGKYTSITKKYVLDICCKTKWKGEKY